MSVKITVPATSANLGIGYDCLGMAVSLYSEFTFERADELQISGCPEKYCNENNLVYRSFELALAHWGEEPFPIKLHIDAAIPVSRGLGSSSTCTVAGIMGANMLLGEPLDRNAVIDLAATIEGHPDNSTPAILGGFCVALLENGHVSHVRVPVHGAIDFVVFIPDFQLSTEKARQALPGQLAFKDAVHNVSRVSLLPAAMNPAMLATGQHQNANALLFAATQDRLHQPYRAPLMEPSWALIEKLRSHGFASMVSGAGPCVLVLHHGDAREQLEQLASEELASGHWRVLHLGVDTKGVQVERV